MEIKPVRVLDEKTGKSVSSSNNSNIKPVRVLDEKTGKSVKKKSTMASPSEQNQEDASLDTSTTETKKPSVSSGSVDKNLFRGDAGAGEQTYRLDKSSGVPVWKEYSSTMVDYSGKKPQYDVYDKTITDPTRVKTLNKFFKQNASASEVEEVFTGFPGKEANRYRVFNGSWQRMQPNAKEWTTINEDNAVTALNRQFKKDIKPIKGLNVIKEGAKFTDINTKLVSQTEGNVVPYLQKKYSKLGFTFEEAGVGQDYVTVTSKDGKTVDVSLDESNPEEALKLRHFISQNASADHSQKTKYLKAKREEDPNYAKTPEYINALKSLSADEVEDLIDERKASTPTKDLNAFYNSEEYKVYKEKKSEKQKERATKVDQLYYELNNAKTAKDKQYIKSKINTFLSDDIIQKQTDGYNMQLMDVQNAYKKINSEYTNLNSAAASGKLTQEQYDERLSKLNQKRVDLKDSSDGVIAQMKKLEKVTGKYLLDKEKTGSFGGNLLNSFATGISKIIETPAILQYGMPSEAKYERLSPEEKKYLSDKGYNKEQAINYVGNMTSKNFKNEIREDVIGAIGTKGTTKEYSQSKDRGFFETAMAGVAESLPAMIVPGGGAVRTLAMGSQAYASIEDEMLNDPDFETTSMAERSLIAVPYSVGMGLLEEFGFSKMISKDPLAKSLVMKSLTKVLGKKGTTETLETALEKELKSNITKYGLKVVGGTLAEAETGALQSAILDVGLKTVYNQARNYYEGKSPEEIAELTGGGYFNTPDNLKEASMQILEDAAAEAIGGTVMTAAMTGFEKLSNGDITLFNDEDITKLKDLSSDPEMKKMFVAKLRTDMVEGKITKEQAKTKLEALRSVKADFTRIPEDITGPNLKKAVELTIEKKELTKEIEGKDENLVAPKKARIEEINNELKTIGENATKQADIVQAEGVTEETPITEIPQEISNLADEEVVILNVKTLDEVPEQFRDRANLSPLRDIETRKKILGLPIGKKVTKLFGGGYTYTLTGKEVKDYAIQEQKSGQVPVQPEATTSQELEQGKPKSEVEGVTEEENKGVDGKNTDTGDSNIPSQEEKVVEETPSQSQNIIENKINEYEQGTKNEGFTTDIETNARKKAKSIPRTSQALDVETNNLEDLVAKYFISGGKINVNKAAQSLFGNKGGKSVFDEYKSRIGLHSKDGKTINGLAHYLWEQNVDDPAFSSTTDSDWRNAIEQVISSNKGTKSMIDNLLSRSEEGLKNQEQEYWESQYDFDAIKEYDESELMEAESVLDNMTDEEISKMYDEILASEKEIEASTFEEVKSLDTKNPTGLKKALDFLTEIEESLDKFGKETLGVNLPVAVAKVVIKSVKKLVQAGMSLEQAIKQAASDNNVSEKDVNDTLFALKEAKYSYERKIKAKQDNVFLNDPKTGIPKIAQSIKKWSKDQLTTKGNRPNSMFEAQENMDGVIASHLNKVVRISKDFNKVYNAIPKDLREKFLEDYDSYLRGNKKADISDDAKIVANEMRNQIDALSQNIIDAGIAPLGVEEEIRNNLGSYLTRSYEVFKNKDYKAKEEIIQRAKNLLSTQQLKNAQEEAQKNGTDVDFELNRLVNNEIDKLTNKISADDFLGGGKLGSKSKELGVFKEKTDIPIEIRQLMGEFTDPVQNYAETVVKLSALSAKNDFLNKIKDAGMGVYLFTEKSRPEGYNVQIAAPGSDAMNPLNGLYTTPEIAKEFNNLPGELNNLMKIYMKAISLIKWGKTIGSIMTHGKNLFGNLGFVAVNGHTSGAKDAFKAIVSDMKNSSNEEMRKRIDNYIEIGVMNQSTGMNEIRDMFKDSDFDSSLAERLSKRPSIKNKPVNTVLGKANRIRKSIGRGFEYAYQAEDDFFKILAYESELRRYSKAEFNKDIKDLTETERAKIDKTVSNIVKDTMPTFSRIPKIVKALRRSPLLGNFISFQAESYRTAFKTIQLAKDEITSKNPAIRAIGARRIVGSAIYLSARTALLSYYGSAFGMGLAGLAGYLSDDDDEEKELGKDLRKFLPPWATQSDIIPIKNSDGTITYVDMSASDPHGGINKAFNAFFGGDNPIDGAKEAMFSIFKPFLEPEMTAKAMFNLMSGNDNYDRPIWNSEDDWNDMAGNIGSFVWGIAQPGTVTSVNRIIKAEDKLGEIVGGLTGYRPIKVDVGESFGYRVYDYKDRLENAKKLYTNVSYKEDATDEEKEKALEKANLKTEEIYKELMEDYNSAERLGVESKILRTEIKDKLNLSVINLKRLLSGGTVSIKRSRNNPD